MNCGSCSSGWSPRRDTAPGRRPAASGWLPDSGGDRVRGTTGCTWRQLPPVFGASWQTVHRRFTEWSGARVWAKLHRILLDELGSRGELDWARCAIDSVSVRAMKGQI